MRSYLFWLFQLLIFLAFGLAFLQAFDFLVIPGSQLKAAWFCSALIYFLVVEFLIFKSRVSRTRKAVVLGFACLLLWLNLTKFTLGLIQGREITLYNRLEHFIIGVALFYLAFLLKGARFFPVKFNSLWAKGFFVFLLSNLASIIHENFELFFDKAFQTQLFIGPGVYDANIDLWMTFLGTLFAFSLQTWLYFLKLSKKA